MTEIAVPPATDVSGRLPLASVDSSPHELFRRYSDGNFAEVAPDRLSPLAWSVIGPPAERGIRRLYGALVPDLRSLYERPTYTFIGYFGFKPYHNADALFSIVPYTPWCTADDIARHYLQGMDTSHVRHERVARRLQARTVALAARRLGDLRTRYNAAELAVHEAEQMAAACPRLDAVGVRVLKDATNAAWEAHVESTCFAALLVAWSERLGHRRLGDAWDRFGDVFLRPDEVVWQSLRSLPGVAATGFLDSPYYEIGDQDPAWRALAGDLVAPGDAAARAGGDADVPDGADEGLRELLEEQYPPLPRAAFRAVAAQARWLFSDRERSKALMMRSLHAVRTTVLGSGIPGHVDGWAGCTLDELAAGHWDRGRPRVEEFAEVSQVALPSVLDLTARGRRPTPAPVAPPIGVSAGVATGEVYRPEDQDPPPGGILVCERADSPLLHELTMAAGVVCEKGSFLSHVAIICRSLGIPAVVNVAGALRRFPRGEVVRVDGTAGTVEVAT